ncbi:hypothetical protein ACWEKT_16785 [Nocardia takedensis]|uniref:hypothetical protein n=1 Tax=Nocardia takedensis TaxID=259390 RepID=UPI0003117B17|nr:hypothetical protein [Nocardia takedensis]
MATRDVTFTVTMKEQDWALLQDAADCAGMSLHDYLCWHTRLLAQQSRPGASKSTHRKVAVGRRRVPVVVDEPVGQAWADTFAERLHHRADLYRED